MKNNAHSTGRLQQSLDPIAHTIVFPSENKNELLSELNIISTLNEVHIIALNKAKLLPSMFAKKLLKSIHSLRKQGFSPLLQKQAERGLYLSYEHYLIQTLGMNVAGSLHIGRSRNDMNAAAFKLNIRNFYQSIHCKLNNLRSTIIKQAQQHLHLAMPIYSQFQVAQVGTYAYYLLAIEEALARDHHYLQDLFFALDESPLGAAAGCGTSFPIDRQLLAKLLGFSRWNNNALDAVASRDLGLRILSILAVLGTTISRIAQDYQIWTTQEFSFFELPDNLCGSSSMMPQKKNPYLFEVIKGKTTQSNGLLIQALTGMHNVPFGNSYEVGTEALHGLYSTLKNMGDILVLIDLLVGNAKPNAKRFVNSINQGTAIASGIAEHLVQHKKMSFRQAHHILGEEINRAISKKIDPTNEILKLTNQVLQSSEPLHWANINEYGGGPGKETTKMACKNAQQRLKKDITWVKSIAIKWKLAESKLRSEVNKLMN